MSDAQFGWLEYPIAVHWPSRDRALTFYAYNGRGSQAPWTFRISIGLNVGGIFIDMEDWAYDYGLLPISRVSNAWRGPAPPIVLKHDTSPFPKEQAKAYVYWRYETVSSTAEPLETTDTRLTITCLSLNTIRRDFKVPDNILVITGTVIRNQFYINPPPSFGNLNAGMYPVGGIFTPKGQIKGDIQIPISGGGYAGFFTVRVDLKKMVVL